MKNIKTLLTVTVMLAGFALSGCDDQHTRTVIVPAPATAPVVQQYSDGGDYQQPVVVQQAPSTVVVRDSDNGAGNFLVGAMVGHMLGSSGGGYSNHTTVVNHYGSGSPSYRSNTIVNRNTTVINRPSVSTTTRTTTRSGFFGSRSSSSTFKSAPSRSSSFSSSRSTFRRR